MLSDIERKVLRILSNYDLGRRRVPSIRELCIKTGRTEGEIIRVLHVLEREKYIVWARENPNHIFLLERWERRNIW